MTELLMRSDLDSRQQGHARALYNSGQALLRQVNDLLDFARLESGKMQLENIPFSPTELVEEVADTHVELAAKAGLMLSSDCSSTVPYVIGDPHRLRQILTNFLANALKFTTEGSICIKLRVVPAPDEQVRLLCEVSDSGMGIAEDRINRVFNAFVQADGSTSRRFGGSGLGLSICKELIEAMGGEIGVDSVLGEGSRFWVRLIVRLPAPSRLKPCHSPTVFTRCGSKHRNYSWWMTTVSTEKLPKNCCSISIVK